jgi:hypothetical protein
VPEECLKYRKCPVTSNSPEDGRTTKYIPNFALWQRPIWIRSSMNPPREYRQVLSCPVRQFSILGPCPSLLDALTPAKPLLEVFATSDLAAWRSQSHSLRLGHAIPVRADIHLAGRFFKMRWAWLASLVVVGRATKTAVSSTLTARKTFSQNEILD